MFREIACLSSSVLLRLNASKGIEEIKITLASVQEESQRAHVVHGFLLWQTTVTAIFHACRKVACFSKFPTTDSLSQGRNLQLN